MVNNFFTDEEVKDLEVQGQIFKFKPTTAGDELSWINDYYEDVEEIVNGNKVFVKKYNSGKEMLCKLRNIVMVPFSTDELKEITKLDKHFTEYSNADKDLLFGKLKPSVYVDLTNKIKDLKDSKKKE
jgi:hypothetical protein